jgi:hypothetical protein
MGEPLMAFAADYVDVAERIRMFRDKHPEGSLRPADLEHPYRIEQRDDQTVVVVVAAAYRTADDPTPGIGMAWEPWPGLTNFTRNSELQNAETSAWGRAIVAALAADTKHVATSQDVENRQAEDEYRQVREAAAPGLRTSIDQAIEKMDGDGKTALKVWLKDNNLPAVRRMDAAQCDLVLAHIMEAPF